MNNYTYTTKDSGKRREFDTKSIRESKEGRGRFDLIPPIVIERFALLLERGCKKYPARNWELGQPLSVYIDSALRHTFQLLEGDNEEDHATAVTFNMAAIIHHRDMIDRNLLPNILDDLPKPVKDNEVSRSYDNTDKQS